MTNSREGVDEKKRQIVETIDELKDELVSMAKTIYQNPELCFKERIACKTLSDFLSKEGFALEEKVAGLETAFRGVWRGQDDGPRLAFLGEYDALPDLGHGCGHHLMGAGSVGAAAALKRVWPDLPGAIEVLGTPAEEGGGGKILMIDEGVFQGIDAVLMFHPSSKEHLVIRGATAAISVKLKFFGKAAHAAGAPHKGINALDAVLQVFHSINALREHLKEDVRIHGIITHGGDAPNIVPRYAEAAFILRSKSTSYLKERVKPQFLKIAEAAALATGAKLETEEGLLYAERKSNRVLARLFTMNLEELGAKVSPPTPNEGSGSSDIGNVSLIVPTIHPYIAIVEEEIPGHTIEFAQAGDASFAYDQMIVATKAMAMTVFDLLANPEQLAEVKEDFKRAVEEVGLD